MGWGLEEIGDLRRIGRRGGLLNGSYTLPAALQLRSTQNSKPHAQAYFEESMSFDHQGWRQVDITILNVIVCGLLISTPRWEASRLLWS